jgi:transcriptional regulator with XRE-family HTH domain
MNASELARRLKISPTLLSRIFSGERNPDKDLDPWADIFDLKGQERREFLVIGYLGRSHPLLGEVNEEQRREIAILRKQLEAAMGGVNPGQG